MTLFCAVFGMAWGGSITFADLGLENGVQYTDPFDGGDFTVTFAGGANDGKYYTTGSGIRLYKGGTMTVQGLNGKNIVKIEVTYAGDSYKPTDNNVVDCGEYNAETGVWTGSSNTVVFTRPDESGHWRIQAISVTVENSASGETVETPTFSPKAGTYTEAQTVTIACATSGATIYYTTNGSTPSSTSTKYTSPITVSETTTLKAIAIKGSAKSSVATATYTIKAQASMMTIAQVRAQQTGDVYTSGTVTSISSTTAYIQDATAAICVYGNGAKNLVKGDKINVQGTLSTYKGLLEITNPVCEVLSQGNTVTPTVKTIAEINSDYAGQNALQGWLVKIEGATVTEVSGSNTTIAQGENTIVVRGITGVTPKAGDIITLTGNIGCFDAAQIANPTDITIQSSGKEEAGLAWSADKATATIGATNTFPTLTNPHSLAITYSSSDTNVATIAADGKITLKAAGTTTIKATSAETDTYKAGEATYALTVKEQSGEQGDYLFHETFDQVNGTGGNDGTFNGASSKLNNNGQNPTDETWDVLTSVYGGKQCMRYGTGSADGVATTRSIALTGNGTLTFRAAGWNGTAANTLNVSATGATLSGDTEITLVNEQWNEYTVNISGGSGDVVITFSGRRGFLDEIGVTGEGGETPPTKQQAGLAWSEATAEATIGATNNEFPTLTNPHSLPVTYTSSKEDVATIAADGTITLVGEGKTTIKAASAETANYYAGSATYELTVVSGLAEAGLAWSTNAAEVYLNASDNEFPTLSNPNNLPVTYTSGTKSVATIDESTGEITLLAPGKTTITATFAGDDNFKEGSAQYTLTVKNKAVEGNDVFVLVEDASTLKADDEIIFVGSRTANEVTTYYGLSTTQNSNNRGAEIVELLSDGTIKPNSNVQRFTLEGNASGWYFGCDAGYIYASSSSGNQLKTKTEADDNAKATIAIEEGIATVIFQGSNTRNDLRFNYNGGTPLFACYASTNTSMPKVQIFRRQTPATSVDVTIGSTGYATLYYSNKNLKIPSGVTAYTCKTNDGKKTIDTRSYTSVIPAGSAVVLKANPGTYTFQFAATGGTPAADNMLCGTDKVAAPVAPGDGEYTFYKLADGENGLRFYKVESGFKNGAHKAYLAVPASVAADSYSFELPDGIEDITVSPALEGATVYTLSGVRMNTNKLPAGIYIVNGKKVVIK